MYNSAEKIANSQQRFNEIATVAVETSCKAAGVAFAFGKAICGVSSTDIHAQVMRDTALTLTGT